MADYAVNYRFPGWHWDRVRAAVGLEWIPARAPTGSGEMVGQGVNGFGQVDAAGATNIVAWRRRVLAHPIPGGTGNDATPYEIVQREGQADPANDDALGILYRAQNDAGNNISMAQWDYIMTDVTEGSEDGQVWLSTMQAGTLGRLAEIDTEFRFLDGIQLAFGTDSDVTMGHDITLLGLQMTFDNITQGTVENMLVLDMDCVHASGATDGFGARMLVRLDDDGGQIHDSASIDFVLTDVSANAEKCDVVFRQIGWMTDGSGTSMMRETLRLISDSTSTAADVLQWNSRTYIDDDVVDVMRLLLTTDGTPTNNLGAGISIHIENDNNDTEERAAIDFVLTDVVSTSEECDIVFSQMGQVTGGGGTSVVRETLRLVSNSSDVFADKLLFTALTYEANGIVDIMELRLSSDNTVANNLGAGISIQIENDNSQVEERAAIDFQLTDVGDGGEDCDMIFRQSIAGASVARLTLDADGPIILIGPLTISIDDANNATVTDILTLTHTTSGVPGAGIGTGLSFEVEDGTLAAEQHGSIDVVTTDVTDTTEDSDMLFSIMVNGTVAPKFNLNADGLSALTGTAAGGLDIVSATLTNGTALDISDLDAIIAGKAIHVDATGVTHTTGILVHIDSASTNLTGAGRLLLIDATGDFNDGAGIVAEIQTVHTTGTGLQLTMDAMTDGIGVFGTFDALTTGQVVSLTHTTSVIADGGSMLRLSSTGIDTGGATNGTILDISSTAQIAGTVALITSAIETGNVFEIRDTAQTTGNLAVLTGGGATLASGGALIRADMGAATAGSAIELVTSGAYTGTDGLLNISAVAATGGTIVTIGDLDALTTGTGLNIASGSEAIAAGQLAAFALTSSGSTITAKTGALVSLASTRTELAAAATADDYDVLSVIRTNITDTLGTLTAAGSVARFENIATQTAGTLTDTTTVLELVQDAQSTGNSINIDHNGAASGIVVVSGSDATTATLDITNESGGYGIDVSRNLAAANTDSPLAYINDDGASDQAALHIHTDAVSDAGGMAIFVDADLMTTINPIELTADALTSGIGVNLTSSSTGLTTNGRILRVNASGDFDDAGGAAAEIISVHTTGTGLLVTTDAVTDGYGTFLTADALTSGIGSYLSTSSTNLTTNGRLLKVDATGDFDDAGGQVVEIASVHTTGTGLQLTMDAVTDGFGAFMTADALTSGVGFEIESSSTALTTNGRLLLIDSTADFNDTGGYIAEISGAFTTGRGLNIVNNVITDGFLTHINSSSAVLDATGRMLLVDHTGGATVSGILAEIASNATDETVIFKVTASSTLIAGIAVDISVASMTTGIALDISDADALTTGGIADFSSNSTDVSARQLLHIHNENVLAVGTVPLNIANAAAGNDIEVANLDPGTTGVILDLHHDSANPAVDDVVASLRFAGEDSGGVKTIFGQTDYIIADDTAGSEEGRVIHYTPTLDGSLVETFREEVGDLKPTRLNSQSYEWIEDFDDEASGVQFEAGLVADFWTTAGTNYNANNVTYIAGPNGEVQAITAGANDDSVTSMAVANWRVDQNPILEARFKVLDITNVWICVGFAEGSFADKGTLDDDIIVVGIDSDNGHGFGADQIVAVTNDNNAGGVYNDCGVAITLDTYITIRMDCTDTEQPRIWVNNTGGEITAANEVDPTDVTGTIQAGTSIAPYFMVQSLTAAADTFTIDYIKAWQARG